VEITFLGGCKEVGGSGVLIRSGDDAILLDYGIYLRRTSSFPESVPPKEIKGVFLTHAHLDHSGALPLLYISGEVPVYATPVTFEATELLLNDLLKISEAFLPFEEAEIFRFKESSIHIKPGETIRVGTDITVKAFDAGHIPGSLSYVVEVEGKRILYTGDINTQETQLLKRADTNYPKLDIAIVESTYALREHPDRRKLEEDFIESVMEIVEGGGIVLVPAFAISRSQEILCVLYTYGFDYPIYLDGMAKKASRIFLKYPSYFRDYELFYNAHKKTRWVKGEKVRKRILKEPGIVIAPAGMLSGGSAVFYAEHILQDADNGVFLVGYQVPGTPGRMLLESGKLPVANDIISASAAVKYFDFSAHCGRTQLLDLVRSFKGNPQVLTVHGEPDACISFAEEINEEVGLNTFIPERGETIEI